MFSTFNFQELISAFIVLFAVIDIIGSIPIILNLKQGGRDVNATQATLISPIAGSLQTGDRRVRPRLGLRHGTPLASRIGVPFTI